MDLRIAVAVMVVTFTALTLCPGAGLARPKSQDPVLAARGDERPIRSVRTLALSAHFEIVVSDPKPVPLLGLRMTGNLLPWLGWHATAVSSEIVTKIDTGMRGYLLRHQLSPYLALSGGVVIVHISRTNVAPTFNAMAGVELATRAGLHIYAEGGLVLLNRPAFMGTTGVGYRF
jgi:hypothetical protein